MKEIQEINHKPERTESHNIVQETDTGEVTAEDIDQETEMKVLIDTEIIMTGNHVTEVMTIKREIEQGHIQETDQEIQETDLEIIDTDREIDTEDQDLMITAGEEVRQEITDIKVTEEVIAEVKTDIKGTHMIDIVQTVDPERITDETGTIQEERISIEADHKRENHKIQ